MSHRTPGQKPDGDRAQFHEVLPETYKRLLALHQHVERMADEHGVPRRLLELVKVRASQINGCAFCVDLHRGEALQLGESERRLTLLPVWREAGLFDDQERAALALAEAMSRLSQTQEVPDEVYDEAAAVFPGAQLGVVVWAASLIQAFNALNVTSRKPLR